MTLYVQNEKLLACGSKLREGCCATSLYGWTLTWCRKGNMPVPVEGPPKVIATEAAASAFLAEHGYGVRSGSTGLKVCVDGRPAQIVGRNTVDDVSDYRIIEDFNDLPSGLQIFPYTATQTVYPEPYYDPETDDYVFPDPYEEPYDTHAFGCSFLPRAMTMSTVGVQMKGTFVYQTSGGQQLYRRIAGGPDLNLTRTHNGERVGSTVDRHYQWTQTLNSLNSSGGVYQAPGPTHESITLASNCTMPFAPVPVAFMLLRVHMEPVDKANLGAGQQTRIRTASSVFPYFESTIIVDGAVEEYALVDPFCPYETRSTSHVLSNGLPGFAFDGTICGYAKTALEQPGQGYITGTGGQLALTLQGYRVDE